MPACKGSVSVHDGQSGIGVDGLAKSVGFAEVAGDIVFDDVTFGGVIPDPAPVVPVPTAFPLLAGGPGMLRRRRKAA